VRERVRLPMTPSVSVVIPTYNGAAFMRETLGSVLAQTRPPQEILIVDDRSSDDIERVVAEIGHQTTIPIRFMRLPRNTGGPSAPLNVGIAAAQGEFIVTLDQDDLMRPRRIEVSLRALETHPSYDLAAGRFSIIGRAEGDTSAFWPTPQFSDLGNQYDPARTVNLLDSRTAFSALLMKTFTASASNFTFTKKVWETVGGFDEAVRTCSDTDFVLKTVVHGRMLVVNEILFDYRWRDTSTLHINPQDSYVEATLTRLRAAAAKPDWAGAQRRVLEQRAVYAATAALRKGDLSNLLVVVKTLRRAGSVGALLRHSLLRSRRMWC
jgi:glycosyltransferase involved in cell wall biosynthesis